MKCTVAFDIKDMQPVIHDFTMGFLGSLTSNFI